VRLFLYLQVDESAGRSRRDTETFTVGARSHPSGGVDVALVRRHPSKQTVDRAKRGE
jgi:hypothetical protein